MVDPILYAIACILSAITTTILPRVHTIVNPQASTYWVNVKQQIATRAAASRALAVFLRWVIIITSVIIILVVITNPLALISSYTITDFFLFAIALVLANNPLFLATVSFILSFVRSAALVPAVLAIAKYCDREKPARRSAEI